ncbi:MAG: site-specific DNA-methyltransferase [Blastochloris sp.]|nr:site-specific DNA-methyltransferase [Blastochloris sp.]
MASRMDNTKAQQLVDPTVHQWYRFVLSFPDHLVRTLLEQFDIRPGQTVLDPFVGTGTTLVECKKRGIASVGVDANPVTAFASRVKTNWDVDLNELRHRYTKVLSLARSLSKSTTVTQLSFGDLLVEELMVSNDISEQEVQEFVELLPKNWINPHLLHKVLAVKSLSRYFSTRCCH